MNLFWKIYLSMFVSLILSALCISYSISSRQISDVEKSLSEEKRLIGRFLSRQIEVGYFESKWPFQSLHQLSQHRGFLFWWIVRDDGIIQLADRAAFMGTRARDYFPEIDGVGIEGILLGRKRGYGIFTGPLNMGERTWSFWYGFSLNEVWEEKKRIIYLVAGVSLFSLTFFGIILYQVIRHFTKPIRSLVIGASIIGKGDLTHKIDIVSSDELGELALAFNKMAEALWKEKEHLEERIQERTADLNRVGQQLRSSLQEKEVLLREIYHRVKNNLQVVSSLLSLQARTIHDEEMLAVFLESQGRINSMALIHEKLYGSKDLSRIDFADYVPELVQSLFLSYGADADPIKRRIKVGESCLGIETAIPLGLMINELVSNSLKHAFPPADNRRDGQEFEIRVDLDQAEDGTYLLTVSDNGAGFPRDIDFHNPKTLGLQLVKMLANQLDGVMELERGVGSTIRIKFAELQYRERGLL